MDNNKRKNVFLHIGVPKSGSSTITSGLTKNKKLLQSQNYLYPSSGISGTRHFNIFYDLTSLPEHKAKFKPERGNLDDLVKEVSESKCDNAIISSEAFALLRPSEISVLSNKLKNFDVKVVVYLRRQDQVIQSGWSQNAKRLVFQRTLDENIKLELSNKNTVYHYDELLKLWSSYFGKQNMIVRVLERDQLIGHIFHDFLYVCGIKDYESYAIPESANVSPSAKIMGVILEISKFIDFEHLEYPVRHEIGKAIEFYGRSKGWEDGDKFNQIDEAKYKEIMSHFNKGNQKVASEYLNQETLFQESFLPKRLTSYSNSQISNEELVEMVAYVVNVVIPKVTRKS